MQELFAGGLIGFLVLMISLYFVIKWAVRTGINEAYQDITGKKTARELAEEAAIAQAKEE